MSVEDTDNAFRSTLSAMMFPASSKKSLKPKRLIEIFFSLLECFWHVRSGAAVSDTAARAALTVAGLGACEAECIRAHAFFCRGFSFR